MTVPGLAPSTARQSRFRHVLSWLSYLLKWDRRLEYLYGACDRFIRRVTAHPPTTQCHHHLEERLRVVDRRRG